MTTGSLKEQRRMRKLHIAQCGRARSKADPRVKRELPRPAIKGPINSRVTGSFTLELPSILFGLFFVPFLRRFDELPHILCESVLHAESRCVYRNCNRKQRLR